MAKGMFEDIYNAAVKRIENKEFSEEELFECFEDTITRFFEYHDPSCRYGFNGIQELMGNIAASLGEERGEDYESVKKEIYSELDKNILDLDELILYAQKATKDGVYGLSHEKGIYWALPYLRTFGGGLLNEKLEDIISSNESVEGIDFYNSLVKKYNISPSDSQVGSLTQAQMFLNGKIVFYLSGRWMYPKIKEKANFNWAVINFPYGKSPQYCDVSGWVISKDSKHKNSALKFVEFLSSEKSSKYFTETGLIVPARIEAAKLLNNNEHNEKVFLNVIKKSQNTPTNKDYKKIIDKINLEEF